MRSASRPTSRPGVVSVSQEPEIRPEYAGSDRILLQPEPPPVCDRHLVCRGGEGRRHRGALPGSRPHSRSCLWGPPARPGLPGHRAGHWSPVNSPLGMKKVRVQPKGFCDFAESSGIILGIRTDFNLKKIMYTIYNCMHVLVYI